MQLVIHCGCLIGDGVVSSMTALSLEYPKSLN